MYPTAGNVDEIRLGRALEAKRLFMALLGSPVPRIAVENPTPLKVVGLPAHSQVIQPYQFGHPYSKRTLLWLRGLPQLKSTNPVAEWVPYLPSNTGGAKRGHKATPGVVSNAKDASKTFRGVAEAMADQWGAGA